MAGEVTKKRQRLQLYGGSLDMNVAYGYTADLKLDTVLYPGDTVPYKYSYDLTDRVSSLKGPSPISPLAQVDHLKNLAYAYGGDFSIMPSAVRGPVLRTFSCRAPARAGLAGSSGARPSGSDERKSLPD